MPLLTTQEQASMTKDSYVVALEEYAQEPVVHEDIYSMESDDEGMGTKMTDVLGVGRFTKITAESEDYQVKNPKQGFTKRAKYEEFALAMEFSKRLVERNVKFNDILMSIATTVGESYRVEKEVYGATPFNNGGDLSGNDIFNGTYIGETDASGDVMYDSEPLFNLSNNTRSSKQGTTYYNSTASLTLTRDNFQTTYVLFTNTNSFNEIDFRVSIKPDTLITDLGNDQFMAARILQSGDLPNTALNDINPTKASSLNGMKHIAWGYLSDSAYYVMKRKTKDVAFINAEDLETKFWRNNNNGAYRWSATFMIGIKWWNWRMIARGGGSST